MSAPPTEGGRSNPIIWRFADGGAKSAGDVDGFGEGGEEADLGVFPSAIMKRRGSGAVRTKARSRCAAALAFAEGFSLEFLHGGADGDGGRCGGMGAPKLTVTG